MKNELGGRDRESRDNCYYRCIPLTLSLHYPDGGLAFQGEMHSWGDDFPKVGHVSMLTPPRMKMVLSGDTLTLGGQR